MKKGAFIIAGLTTIVLSGAIAIASVLIFFHVFRVNTGLQMREHYIWNKVQELPLDLLSVDLNGEPFVTKMNKVYYLGDDTEKEQLKNDVDDLIDKQFFYYYGGPQRPFDGVIKIADIEITKYMEGCEIIARDCDPGGSYWDEECYCVCSDDCSDAYKGVRITNVKIPRYRCGMKDIRLCIALETVKYSASYPFPLAFNGTDKLIDELSYNVVEGG